MKVRALHPWRVSVREALAIQKRLAGRIVLKNGFSEVRRIAGADLAVDTARNQAVAGVIVFEFPSLRVLERQFAWKLLQFPYVPGLLSFREAPVLLDAFQKVRLDPDVVVFDGQGIAHPRRLGIASHMGLVLDRPALGCAKSVLTGKYEEPGRSAGSRSWLKDGEEIIGAALRTRDGVRPVYVSPGHRIDLPTSLELMRSCCRGTRIPVPTREADLWVGELKRKVTSHR